MEPNITRLLRTPSGMPSDIVRSWLDICDPTDFENLDEMADFDHLDVSILDFDTGKPLINYDTAETIRWNSYRQRRSAVEAKPDQRFTIQVRVKSSFDWADSNGLEVKLGFDVGEQINSRSVYILKDPGMADGLKLPHFTQDGAQGLNFVIDHVDVDDPEDGVYFVKPAQFYFRHLRKDDLIPAQPKFRSLESQGKIRVEILRARLSLRNHGNPQTDSTPNCRRQIQSKLLAKGITLEVLLHKIPQLGETASQPSFKCDQSKILKQQTNFDFIYREAGRHDEFVDRENIIDVVTAKRSSETAMSPTSATLNNAQTTRWTGMSDCLVPTSLSAPASCAFETSSMSGPTASDSNMRNVLKRNKISCLVEVYEQGRGADLWELEHLDSRIEQLARREQVLDARRQFHQVALKLADSETEALRQTRKRIEEHRVILKRESENRRRRQDEAVAGLCEAVQQSTQQGKLSDKPRKRKRSEDEI